MADDSADTGDLGTDALSVSMDGVRTRTRDLTAGSNAFARAITAAFAQGASGPEWRRPLAPGPDGRLGVAASGAVSNVTVNIATPDAESFRRSETYLTGLIARAVARGQRGL